MARTIKAKDELQALKEKAFESINIAELDGPDPLPGEPYRTFEMTAEQTRFLCAMAKELDVNKALASMGLGHKDKKRLLNSALVRRGLQKLEQNLHAEIEKSAINAWGKSVELRNKLETDYEEFKTGGEHDQKLASSLISGLVKMDSEHLKVAGLTMQKEGPAGQGVNVVLNINTSATTPEEAAKIQKDMIEISATRVDDEG